MGMMFFIIGKFFVEVIRRVKGAMGARPERVHPGRVVRQGSDDSEDDRGEGYDNTEIGQRLNIAPTTARNSVHRILRKLRLRSRLRLVSFSARRENLISR